jgi:hypothetical protein
MNALDLSISTARRLRPWLAGGLLLASVASQAQSISILDTSCVPRKGNGVVRAEIKQDLMAGQSPRVYFRWRNHGTTEFYWVSLEAEPDGTYWAVLPRPEERNTEVEYYMSVVDAAGREKARSAGENRRVPVRKDCTVRLNERQQGVAENLIVGETSAQQFRKPVFGFLCPGVRMRIDHRGVRRADEVCGPCGLAWLGPSALANRDFIGVIEAPEPEPSPSRP